MTDGQDGVPSRQSRNNKSLWVFWLLVAAAMPVWIHFDNPGWDVAIYHSAMKALSAGHDPYSDAIAVQTLFHQQKALHPHADPPYSYVYSPLTLPLLAWIASVPARVSGTVYWLLYLAGVLGEVWVGVQLIEREEKPFFLYLAPLAPFFPGFIENGTVMSGNIAYILYAVVLGAAVLGWRRGRWVWFYAAVVAASCVKAPLLSLVAIPVLSARRQWVSAVTTAAAGAVLFAMQPLIWPSLFRHYLQAVELQFSYNRDFGCSPAGLFSGVLFDYGIPYSPASMIFYLCYAVPLFALLLWLSREFFRGSFALTQWAPVLLVGVILLNPRLIEYDVAPLALPLALIGWRFLRSVTSVRRAGLILGAVFAVTNGFALFGWEVRKLVDGPLLVCFFLAGSWKLARQARETTRAVAPAAEVHYAFR